jgi:hypothetical protein
VTAAARRGTTRSGLLAQLLSEERIRERVRSYIDVHGWDMAEDAEGWREYQRRGAVEEYGADEW